MILEVKYGLGNKVIKLIPCNFIQYYVSFLIYLEWIKNAWKHPPPRFDNSEDFWISAVLKSKYGIRTRRPKCPNNPNPLEVRHCLAFESPYFFYTHVDTYTHTHIHKYTHAHIHTCAHLYTYTYIRKYKLTYIRTYIHT